MAAELYNGWWISANQYEVGPSSGNPSSNQQHNADKIYSRFHNSLGWTVNAVAGMIGNIMYESCLNPACSYPSIGNTIATIGNTYAQQYPDRAYGLVQWLGRGSTDPNNNQLVGYAIRHNAEWYDGNIQMDRLDWEYTSNSKFHAQTIDGVYWTFSRYAQSIESPETLAKVWMLCYEGTNSVLGTRQQNALYWYTYFNGTPIVDSWVQGNAFANYALAYNGRYLPYSQVDCIQFVNMVWRDIQTVADHNYNLTMGTNSLWRSTRTFPTTSPDNQSPTPELWYKDTIDNCIATYGSIPTGTLLFHKISNAGLPPIPSQYANDGIGNFAHVGIYCGDNKVMQSGGRDSSSVVGGGVHLSQYDSSAWNYCAFVVYVDCTGQLPPTPPPDPPHYLPYGYFLMMLNKKERRLVKRVKRYVG